MAYCRRKGGEDKLAVLIGVLRADEYEGSKARRKKRKGNGPPSVQKMPVLKCYKVKI
jgi:hypothetical protein